MALQKQNFHLDFAQGIDTKTDPWQLPPTRMLMRSNSVFDKGKQLKKRYGYEQLTTLSDTTARNLATYQGNLVALGTSLQLYSNDSNQWLNQGAFQPMTISGMSIVRSSSSQSATDVAVAPNGLGLVVFLDTSNSTYFYQIFDSVTGGQTVSKTALPSTATGARAHVLGANFIITFFATVSATPRLQYIAIPIGNPTAPASAVNISSQVSANPTGYDAYVYGTQLYVAWNGSDGGGAVRITYLDAQLNQHGTIVITGKTADLVSITVDSTSATPVVWLSYWDTSDGNGYSASFSQFLSASLASTKILNTVSNLLTLTSAAAGGSVTVFYQTQNNYSYASVRSDYVSKVSCTNAGAVSAISVVLRSVGLASKAFYVSSIGKICVGLSYGGTYQPTYFFSDSSGNIVARLAYSNGGGYVATQVLSQVNLSGTQIQFGYLFKDQLVPVNKELVGSVGGIYSTTGVNLGFIDFAGKAARSELGGSLNLSGGFLWMYDALKPVENNFHVWPEDLKVTTSALGGSITAQTYNYVATYEWTDGQGFLHRSAPSIAFSIVTTGATSTNTINVPTLRLTAKAAPNNVRLVIYRWSTSQQVFYQITSITSPQLNDPTTDSIAYTDTVADSSILGNVILYTTGGVVENIGPPASDILCIFKGRLFLVDAEDPNLLWYSKQVIEDVPVEMSDLFTLFVSPTIGAQGNTGPITALAAMDDKLIVFKQNAIYFISGNGPDNTGSNNDFSEPSFITSTVGCTDSDSIVFMPNGIMFQSDKGIWLLSRNLSTSYIGAEAEAYNSALVLSSLNVSGTNQLRFTLDSGVTLVYDYFYGQWGTFNNIPALSSVLFQNLHTYINSFGQVFQEKIGSYIDGSNPVLQSLQTAWINLAGVQGYMRFYYFYLLGQYLSPHKIQIQIAYDYNPSPSQTEIITPTNFNNVYGVDPFYGSTSVYGGNSQVEWWRIFPEIKKCTAFQLTLTEIFDSSLGAAPGAGFTLSGLNLIIGGKDIKPKLASAQSVG